MHEIKHGWYKVKVWDIENKRWATKSCLPTRAEAKADGKWFVDNNPEVYSKVRIEKVREDELPVQPEGAMEVNAMS